MIHPFNDHLALPVNSQDDQYHSLISDIVEYGYDKNGRTVEGYKSLFGISMVFDIRDQKIPLLTTKKVFHRGIREELLWMISGNTRIEPLLAADVHIWDSWVDPKTATYDDVGKLTGGDLPKIYQHQWRHWEDVRIVAGHEVEEYLERGFSSEGILTGSTPRFVVKREIDQLKWLIDRLRKAPDCRRMVVSAWNAAQIEEMALPPCHYAFQVWTRELTELEQNEYRINNAISDDEAIPTRALSMSVNFRSWDKPIGAPFNYVQYAIFAHLIVREVGMVAERLVINGGDVHVYQNQFEGIEEHLSRTTETTLEPRIVFDKDAPGMFDIKADQINVIDYDPQPGIVFPQAAV